ncbi:hypothetical protein YPPY12_1390, partial [Yersinia pestis PY-12]|jgi:putative PIN family toxin of toxin-antitoxin system
MMSV